MVTAGDIIRASRKKAGIAQTQTPESVARIAREEPKKARRSWTSAGALAKAEIAARPTPTPTRTPLPAGTTAEDTLAGIDATTPTDRLDARPITGGIIDPFSTGQTAIDVITTTPGAMGLMMGAIGSIDIANLKSLSKLGKFAKVGTKGKDVLATSTVGNIAVNEKTTSATINWLTKVGLQLQKPRVIAGTIAASIVTAIGSYPFAGFIKEEALQTTGMAVNAAVRNNDFEGAETAIALQKEILDPNIWDEIKSKVPYVNVLNSLNDYYAAARLKVSVDEQVIADMKIQLETEETISESIARNLETEKQNDLEIIEKFNESRIETEKEIIRLNELADETTSKGILDSVKARLKLETDHAAEQRSLEEEERVAIANFWLAYHKRVLELQALSNTSSLGGSTLNFGLI